jgi:hypothetical protein
LFGDFCSAILRDCQKTKTNQNKNKTKITTKENKTKREGRGGREGYEE